MTPIVEFFARGLPKGQPRPRAFARKMGGKYVARVFDAGTAEQWKSQVAMAAELVRPDQPFAGPVSLALHFNFPRPKAHFKGKGHLLKDSAPCFCTSKPDADNLAKAVMDALTQLGGFWKDDAQVTRLLISKSYTDECSGCLVVMKEHL